MIVFGKHHVWLRPAAILLSLVALYVVAYRPGGAPADAFRQPFGEAISVPALPSQAPPTPQSQAARAPVAKTRDLLIYTSAGSYSPATVESIAQPLQEALDYVQQRTDMALVRPVNIVFDRRPEVCGPDAIAYTEVRTLILYACPETPTGRAVNILAHEFVHQLAHDRYGSAHLQADIVLTEGVATWGAGRYWLGGKSSFRHFVAEHYSHDLLPLDTDSRGATSIDTMNQLYYQWASYIEWLRETAGVSSFATLYVAESGRAPGSAPYEQALGMSFAETEARWQAWVKQASAP